MSDVPLGTYRLTSSDPVSGIGATLTTAFGRYEFESVSSILILIIAMVFAAEVASVRLRKALL